ncbi:hypothetical protein B0T14DRAFT_84800 [Immersiella caudata]|uniref:Uncharacterized protein n=1 Tax=Immersiella caudata TaxID=314043 RepID=A0AA40CDA4_9PEZI|nr:hypothetical protein B0T14DRAFT_84800 [Immersiella caudata]
MATIPHGKFACSKCGKQYQQSSHLHRHELTHNEGAFQKFQCKYCESCFVRRDVWRRHLSRCSHNVNHNEAPLARRGQKPRACDRCYQRKLACDAAVPCGRCSSGKFPCSYNRRLVEAPESESTTATPERHSEEDLDAKMAATFLLHLTNPKAETMVEFIVEEPEPEPGPADQHPSSDAAAEFTPEPTTPFEPDFLSNFTEDMDLFLDERFFPWPLTFPSGADPLLDSTCQLWLPDDMLNLTSNPLLPTGTAEPEPILESIITSLHAVHTTLLQTDPTYDSVFDLSQAQLVFTPTNRALLVTRYFQHTHREFPLTHRPSLDLSTVSPGLLLAFFLSGSMFMTPAMCARGMVSACRVFMRVAEEFVFRELEQKMARVSEDGKVVEDVELYEALQAALLVHCTQFSLQDVEARKRNRTTRLPVLVGAVRTLGLMKVRHAAQEEMPGWEAFVREETRLRIGAWVLLADWQQSGMFRLPPLMTVSELTGDFPCLPSLWEAKSAEEFYTVITAGGPSAWNRSCSIRQAVESLMTDAAWSGLDKFPLRHATVQDLHYLIFAIHCMAGSAALMGLLPCSSPSLLRATKRWEQLWGEVIRVWTTRGKELKDMPYAGTMAHRLSPELCWLAKRLIVCGVDEKMEYYKGVGHYSLDSLHALIEKLRVR